jgi:hypothetical protein
MLRFPDALQKGRQKELETQESKKIRHRKCLSAAKGR